MKDSFLSTQKPNHKIDLHIQIVTSNNPRLNDLREDVRITLLETLRKHYTKVEVTIVDNLSDLEKFVAKNPDLVILGMGLVPLDSSISYDDSPKVWIADYLEENEILYTGSRTKALILQRNKEDAKQMIRNAGLQTASFFVVKVNESVPLHNLQFPLFVKPSNRGDSKGVDENSVTNSPNELVKKVASIHNEHGSDAIVEEYLPGREFSVAVMRKTGDGELLAMPIEITTIADRNGNMFLSESIKQADSENVLAINDAKLKKTVQDFAIKAFTALGARDYGRIDMRLDANLAPNFIEANLMPGLSNHGYLMRCFALNESFDYEEMILTIVSLASERSETFANGLLEQPANDSAGNEILA